MDFLAVNGLFELRRKFTKLYASISIMRSLQGNLDLTNKSQIRKSGFSTCSNCFHGSM